MIMGSDSSGLAVSCWSASIPGPSHPISFLAIITWYTKAFFPFGIRSPIGTSRLPSDHGVLYSHRIDVMEQERHERAATFTIRLTVLPDRSNFWGFRFMQYLHFSMRISVGKSTWWVPVTLYFQWALISPIYFSLHNFSRILWSLN